jgi:hypothetical protein
VADPVEGRPGPAALTLVKRGGCAGCDQRPRARRHRELGVGRLGAKARGRHAHRQGAHGSRGAMGGSGGGKVKGGGGVEAGRD